MAMLCSLRGSFVLLLFSMVLPRSIAVSLRNAQASNATAKIIPDVLLDKISLISEPNITWQEVVQNDNVFLNNTPPYHETLLNKGGTMLQDFQSTPGQDALRCPLLKLPSVVYLQNDAALPKGSWKNSVGATLATWSGLNMVKINSLASEKLALQAKPLSGQWLEKMYGWISKPVYLQDSEGIYEALIDCDGRLMYVVQLSPIIDGSLAPGHPIQIYGKDGTLLAASLSDQTVERISFVDLNGALLATAESPGLYSNFSRASVITASNGVPLSYQINFEPGSYLNASRFLEEEYRWVIASAVQVRAVYNAGYTAPSTFSTSLAIAIWIGIFLAICILGCIMWGVYRLVYPDPSFIYDPMIYAKRYTKM